MILLDNKVNDVWIRLIESLLETAREAVESGGTATLLFNDVEEAISKEKERIRLRRERRLGEVR